MAKDDEKAEEEKKGGKGKLIIIALVAVLALGGGAYFFVLKPKDSAAAVTTLPEPTPGAVVTLDSITINLAGGHFLKLGLALQPTAAAKETDGSKALDLAIDEFSNMTIDDLSTTAGRRDAKDELIARIKLAYLPEGTILADATGGSSSSNSSDSSDSESKKSDSSDSSDSADETDSGGGGTAEETSVADLTAAQAIKMAKKLTVQPNVYDVYFTEFVMQ